MRKHLPNCRAMTSNLSRVVDPFSQGWTGFSATTRAAGWVYVALQRPNQRLLEATIEAMKTQSAALTKLAANALLAGTVPPPRRFALWGLSYGLRLTASTSWRNAAADSP